jgi:outer membrane protein OmpA-like peptidoglycan-associated protein
MKRTATSGRTGPYTCLAAFVLLLAAGCAAPPQATRLSDELPFEEAVAKATDGLVAQTQTLPAFLAKVESKLGKKGVVLDPMLDSATGQQTGATTLLENRVSERMTTKYDQFEVLPFRAANLSRAQYLLTGTMTRASTDRSRGGLLINLALTDLKSGNVVAQASAIARSEGLDSTPLPYYRDSPILVKDKVIDGYVATSATRPGQRADAFYLERIAAATLINEATLLYNQERYQESLGQYRSALATPAGEQMRVLNGIYLTNVKLGRSAEAEEAFGRVVAFGIASNQLGVKFLFNPGSTEFWADPKVSGSYQMWLRQIARESTASQACMNIVGHTSHTGSEQANDALSLQRAVYIRTKLTAEATALGPKTKVTGMGFRENIVGSGSDNAVDALDRRVEFKIVPCG